MADTRIVLFSPPERKQKQTEQNSHQPTPPALPPLSRIPNAVVCSVPRSPCFSLERAQQPTTHAENKQKKRVKYHSHLFPPTMNTTENQNNPK